MASTASYVVVNLDCSVVYGLTFLKVSTHLIMSLHSRSLYHQSLHYRGQLTREVVQNMEHVLLFQDNVNKRWRRRHIMLNPTSMPRRMLESAPMSIYSPCSNRSVSRFISLLHSCIHLSSSSFRVTQVLSFSRPLPAFHLSSGLLYCLLGCPWPPQLQYLAISTLLLIQHKPNPLCTRTQEWSTI